LCAAQSLSRRGVGCVGSLVPMAALDVLYEWTDLVLFWGLAGLRLWAIVDCATRKAAAFPAVDKLTKPAWLAILVVSGVFGTLIRPSVGIISLISVVVASVYLADVRPAVREISGGKGR
jgi:hypothetical protein